MKTFIILASVLTLAASAQDLQSLLSEAQRDFIRGDKAAAKEKFTLVQKADPKNRLANTYLSLIAAEEKKNGGDDSAGKARGKVHSRRLNWCVCQSNPSFCMAVHKKPLRHHVLMSIFGQH